MNRWGTYKRWSVNNFTAYTKAISRKFSNLNDFPLKVSLFPRYPTCLKAQDLPTVFRGMYLMSESWRSNDFGGVDGLMVQNMAKIMNFSADVIVPVGIDFGYRASNGTFFGKRRGLFVIHKLLPQMVTIHFLP